MATKKSNTESTPCEIYVRKIFRRRDPRFLMVYINHRPHFKILGISYMGGTRRRSQEIVTDDTLRVARALGLRLTKDQEWIIRKDKDSLNWSFSQFLERQVQMDKIY